ncbi:MAG TPA: hypothetical protein VGD55_05840 [Acidothermaceae bacterium]
MPTGHSYTRTPPAIASPIKDEVVGSKEPLPEMTVPLEELEWEPLPSDLQTPDPPRSEPSGSDPPPF